MRRADSLEKTLILRRIEGRRMRWLDGITDWMDMSLSKIRKIVKDREALHAAVHRVAESQTGLRDWTTTILFQILIPFRLWHRIEQSSLCNTVSGSLVVIYFKYSHVYLYQMLSIVWFLTFDLRARLYYSSDFLPWAGHDTWWNAWDGECLGIDHGSWLGNCLALCLE